MARATGVQADMELPFAGLQQLFGSMLGSLELLPARSATPWRSRSVFALGRHRIGSRSGLAILGLLAEVAEQAAAAVRHR